MEYEFDWVYCPECNRTLVLESRVEKGSGCFEMVVCPICGMELGEIPCDGGYDFIGTACGYLYPGKPCCGADA